MIPMIERIARAIYGAAFENHYGGKKPEPGWCWDRAGLVQQEFATRQARAALAEFRRPTEAMVEAAANAAADAYDRHDAAVGAGIETFRRISRAALIAAMDEALADKQEDRP